MNKQAVSKHRKDTLIVIFSALAVTACVIAAIFLVRPTSAVAKNLMDGVGKGQACAPEAPDNDFVSAQAGFSVRLFQQASQAGKNSLVSPVSVSLALGMTANGAQGATLKEFESVLGNGMDINKLNMNFVSEASRLNAGKSGKITLANSVWYRNQNLTVKPDFLKTNAMYYDAAAYQLNFADKGTPQVINNWVKTHTGGKIDKMVEKVDANTVMYLINAMYLEQEWAAPYYDSDDGTFHAPTGDVTAKFLGSEEKYLHDENAEGILKSFKDRRYAFAAILPKNQADLNQYVKSLTGDSFLKLMRSAGKDYAITSFPKFKYEFSADLNQPLKDMGLKTAFDANNADFTKMGSTQSGNIFIGDVNHKTFIEVDETGLKAGAATKVEMLASAANPAGMKHVIFNRPFLYAVIDTETMLPIFLGTVYNPVG